MIVSRQQANIKLRQRTILDRLQESKELKPQAETKSRMMVLYLQVGEAILLSESEVTEH